MKQLLLLLAMAVAFSFTAEAQTSGSSSTPSTGAQDVSTWSKTTKSGSQDKRKAAPAEKGAAESGKAASGGAAGEKAGGQTALTGCLAAGHEDGEFMLTTARDKKKIEVMPEAGVELKPHVGHKVKVTGTWEKAEAAGAQEKAEHKAGDRHFKATKVDHIAAECKQAAAGAGQKRKEQGEKSRKPGY